MIYAVFFSYANTGYKSYVDILKNTVFDKVEMRLTAHLTVDSERPAFEATCALCRF